MKKINSKILGIIILATIFGLASGMVGTLLTRVYVLEDSFNIPFYGEINLSGSQYSGSGLVISNPKKVVVEQNTKISETAKAVRNNIVGIFDKKIVVDASQKETGLNIDNYYLAKDKIAQGVIITSDGWIISNYTPKELKDVSSQTTETYNKIKDKVISDFTIVTDDKKVYFVDDIVIDSKSNLSFWHISGNNFPVKKFVLREEIFNGQLLVGIDWEKNVILTSILNVKKVNEAQVLNSDDFLEEIIFSEDLKGKFNQGFFFDLNGDLAGLIDADGKVITMYSYLPCINCLLSEKLVKRPSLGVSYIDLSKLISSDPNEKLVGALISKNSRGVAVAKNGVAEIAGFKQGDNIISVNSILINENNDLSQTISKFSSGDEVLIAFERDNAKYSVSVKLGQQ